MLDIGFASQVVQDYAILQYITSNGRVLCSHIDEIKKDLITFNMWHLDFFMNIY